MHLLLGIAETYGVAVVLTNQVQSSPSSTGTSLSIIFLPLLR
ncbi:MAG: hypothetical protein M3Y53_07715, partial [Thermoproteota archaeon]|nr:hypothetical protein [Thermoproteota archaeon]